MLNNEKIEWYTLEQVAVELGVSYITVKRWTTSGYLPKPCHLGRAARWNKEDIKTWIVENQGLATYGKKGNIK